MVVAVVSCEIPPIRVPHVVGTACAHVCICSMERTGRVDGDRSRIEGGGAVGGKGLAVMRLTAM
jgi:hypothetical protein